MFCNNINFYKKNAWEGLRDCPNICLEGQRKTTKNLSQYSQSLGQDLNCSPKYKARKLTTQQWSSVTYSINPSQAIIFFVCKRNIFCEN
jgi:hypothetical protein